MPIILLNLVYIGLSFMIGMIGRETKFGFWGNFLVSLILSPLVGLIVMLAQDIRPRPNQPLE